MQYVKKMCILRQLKQGFSCDGKPLSGIIKAEQYGKNIAVEVAIINLAPVSSGEWICLVADAKKRARILPLKEKRHFSFVDELQLQNGFLAAICYVKDEALPVAFGVSGTIAFSAAELVKAVFQTKAVPSPTAEPPSQSQKNRAVNEDMGAPNPPKTTPPQTETYNDEAVTEENYYQWEEQNEQQRLDETSGDAQSKSGSQDENAQEGTETANDENGARVRHAFTTHTDGYYQSVKGELNDLFARYPRDNSLQEAFSVSEWVRVKGIEGSPEELVGVVYEEGMAKYICYALPAQSNDPPAPLKEHCFFVPRSPLTPTEGFFVIFQSAATGETIKPQKA